ncbi:MAG: hypothetical protein AABX93_02875 [Nanoarchaeota archaeon]
MKLENIVKPFKILDEEISRPYARLTKKWEDKGHSRYSLSGACDSGAFLSLLLPGLKDLSWSFSLENISVKDLLIGGTLGPGIGVSLTGALTGDYLGIDEKKGIVTNPVIYFYNKIGKAVRMPELVAGISFAGKGAYDIYDYFKNGNPTLNDGINNLIFGTSLISNASAWYIRQSDPKVLDKKSVFEKAYEKVKEKIGDLIPNPIPVPVPDFKPAYSAEEI